MVEAPDKAPLCTVPIVLVFLPPHGASPILPTDYSSRKNRFGDYGQFHPPLKTFDGNDYEFRDAEWLAGEVLAHYPVYTKSSGEVDAKKASLFGRNPPTFSQLCTCDYRFDYIEYREALCASEQRYLEITQDS